MLSAVCCSFATAEVDLPEPDPSQPIRIEASQASRWTDGAYEVLYFDHGCRLVQGNYGVHAPQGVLWIRRADLPRREPGRVLAYFEQEVEIVPDITRPQVRKTQGTWYRCCETHRSIDVHVDKFVAPPAAATPLLTRATTRRNHPVRESVVRGQFEAAGGSASGTRQIMLFSRSNVPIQADWYVDEATNQSIAIIDSGVNLIVRGLGEDDLGDIDLRGYELGDAIDVSADRLVIWTIDVLEQNERSEAIQADDVPLEIYMEGNVVFRQGDSVIHADRLYYDVSRRQGIILDAELLSPVPNYEGWLRLRAEILQQLGPNRYFAENAFLTSSRMGRPGYRVQVNNATLDDIATPRIDPLTGLPELDEENDPIVDHEYFTTSKNNFLFIRDLPVFYWPWLATDLEYPTFYIKRVRIKRDSMFGMQILTDWDMYQILGWRNAPAGTEWDASVDYLADRGWGHGTSMKYGRGDFFGIPGQTAGLVDYWGIQDRGLDNLGRGRRSLTPEKDYRYRLFWQHRQRLPGDFRVTGEVGWISDRNFLEQYFENEWDELKDETTGIELKRSSDNRSWSITADARLNSFVTDTEWLPRFDHFWLGQELLGDRLTWYEHTSLGYARFRTATQPDDPDDRALFQWLPWESTSPADPLSVEGERFATRHEIDLPLQLGAFKVVPYALGEFAHWGEDINGEDRQRLYGQAGVRASLPVWRVDPTVRNNLFNLKGMAHKVVFDAEFAVAEADQDLSLFPLYDALDDNSIEAFRRRFAITSYGGATPPQLDERSYALRSGLASWVTSPSTEVADDLMFLRLGMRHRWQTKRGAPGNERTVDWVTFDTHATIFPRPDDDNFGELLGLVDYDLRWHLGDRVSVLSSGYFDFYDEGGRMVSIGGLLNRPPRGSIYAGIHFMDGPIRSTVLTYSHSYRMSEKWMMTFGSSVDIANNGNIGQNFSFTRIGESFLVSAGFNVDASRDLVGIQFAVEPRFLPEGRLGQVGGARIPVAGAYGLE